MASPELSVKPIAIIMPSDREQVLIDGLTPRQQGYVIHWLRSNWNKYKSIEHVVRKAKANHP